MQIKSMDSSQIGFQFSDLKRSFRIRFFHSGTHSNSGIPQYTKLLILKIIYILFISLPIVFLLFCGKSKLEKINTWLDREEYEKLLEFANKNTTELTDEEKYLSSKTISKFQNYLRQKKSNEKILTPKYIQNLENKTGLKIKFLSTDTEKKILIEDKYKALIQKSEYYKNKALLDKFLLTVKTNEVYESSFLLADILEIDPRFFLLEFKQIWLESMKMKITATLSETDKEKFLQILHYLASKEETDLKNIFFYTEGTNVNLRSGPGTENITLAKLNGENVIQIDTDYNTTTIGGKTGKWIQIYVWNSDITGWIFSPFLKQMKVNSSLAKSYENQLTQKTNFTILDFNNWNEEEIPSGYYGNYTKTKKQILDGNIGFTIYPTETEQGICTKLKKDTKKITTSFLNENSSERILLFYLKPILSSKSKVLGKIEIWNNRILLNAKELDLELNKKEFQTIELKISESINAELELTLSSQKNSISIQKLNQKLNEVNGWELCIPQGKKSSSKVYLFSFTIF